MAGAFAVSAQSGTLNVRNGPGTDSAVIGKLQNGAAVRVVESQGQWSKLESGGWVHSDYLSPSKKGTGSAMPVNPVGPPSKDSTPGPENTRKLESWLNSTIAGHAGAKTTFTFYEEIDS